MLQAGGIDKLVEQKTDAYRSNPQALQKRYSQNQELMDLLAMQKLKTEKETAARDMQLKAEQTPSTIAEQYEQQLVGMNKNEMTQQTAGIMGERQKKAQQKQRAMGMPPQQAQQRPPMPQAASQGIASQPRPNMQGMAKGGIIGFSGGSEVNGLKKTITQEEIDEYRRKGEQSGQQIQMSRLTDEDIRRILTPTQRRSNVTTSRGGLQSKTLSNDSKLTGSTSPAAASPATQQSIKDYVDGAGAAASGYSSGVMEKFAKPKPPASGDVVDGYSSELMGKFAKPKTPTVQAPDGQAPTVQAPDGQAPDGQAPNYADGIDEQLKSIVGPEAPDTSGLSKKMLTDALDERSPEFMGKVKERMELDPEAKSKETQKRLASSDSEKGGLGIKAYEEKLADYLRQKEDLDRSQLDPEAVARERANAGIRGLIEGGTGRGASIARGKFDANVSKRRRDVINEQRDMFVKNKNASVQIIDKINSGAADALKTYTDDVSNSMQLFSTVTEKDIQLYQEEADRLYRANQNGIKNKIDALSVSVEANMQRLLKGQADKQQMAKSLQGFIKEYGALKEEHNDMYRTAIDAATQKQFDPKSTESEIIEAEETLAGIQGIFDALANVTRLDDLIKMLESAITEGITGVSSGSGEGAGNPQEGSREGSSEERADAAYLSTGG
tara:strand:- start:8834 stop:10834 length:2001 start_codon:yes stop_codon:yes gene_type:complete